MPLPPVVDDDDDDDDDDEKGHDEHEPTPTRHLLAAQLHIKLREHADDKLELVHAEAVVVVLHDLLPY